jgi:hypothetical protein
MHLEFKRTSHAYLNAGIVGLYVYLERAERGRDRAVDAGEAHNVPWYRKLPDFTYGLEEELLWIDTAAPIPFLEEVYYAMGADHYDSSTKEALEKQENAYYISKEDRFEPFPKKKTYGFAALLTNDAAGKTRSENATVRQSTIKEDDTAGQLMLRRYRERFERLNLKLGAQLYRGEPYIKITRLKLTEEDLMSGKKYCPLTGEGFKTLQSATNSSPTAGGLVSFMSGLGTKADKIGWKAQYLIRFAPVLCLYRYTNRLNTLFCYFYDKSTLVGLYRYYRKLNKVYYAVEVKLSYNHQANFRLDPLWPKNLETKVGGRDFIWPNEVLFQLIFTITGDQMKGATDKETGQLWADRESLQLHLLRADKYSGTMRPSVFTVFNNFDYTVRFIKRSVKGDNQIEWPAVLKSLILSKPKFGNNDFKLSRRLRDRVLEKVMTGRSYAHEYAAFLYDCYCLRLAGANIGYKSFSNLNKLFLLNELESLNPHHMLLPETRERAYNLGVQIGVNIMNAGGSPLEAAKTGRKYVIQLNKVRTYEDFLSSIVRILNKYDGIIPSTELFRSEVTEENFETIKLLTTIGALSRINSRLSRPKIEPSKT